MDDAPPIFVALAGDSLSETALKFALSRGEHTDNPIEAVYVSSTEETESRMKTKATTIADDYDTGFSFSAVSRPDSSTVKSASEVGDILHDYIESRDFTYLIMGNESKSLLHKSFVGSATETIIESRDIPVLLVPGTNT